jgi:hypothetical protein
MLKPVPLLVLASANAVCLAISVAIIHFALRDWPIRYANNTLSWSVVLFFLTFIGSSTAGTIATGLLARERHGVLLRVAATPVVILCAGMALGVLKALMTGDF